VANNSLLMVLLVPAGLGHDHAVLQTAAGRPVVIER
jgi:hypothetical protein